VHVRPLGALSTVAAARMEHQTHVSHLFIRRCLRPHVRDHIAMLTMMPLAHLHVQEQIMLSHSALHQQGKDCMLLFYFSLYYVAFDLFCIYFIL
jgi:hypothetical protein